MRLNFANKTLFYLCSIFICLSCQNDVENDTCQIDTLKKGLKDSTFLKEISDLKETELPVNLHCEIFADSFKYIDNNKNEYFDEGEFLVSKCTYPNFTSIISYYVGDYNYPYLKTYSNTGKLIDSIYLFNGHCGEDELEKSEVYTFLFKNYINQIDTTTYYNFDNGNEMTDSIVVTESTIKIDSLGHFIKN